MKISIIVPNYNNEKYIYDCLDSLVNQTYKDLEIIVIDDGSTDSGYEIIKEFAEKDKRIIAKKQSNQGASGARNRGLELATGELIGFVDGDDYCRKDMFEKIADVLVRNNADIAICSMTWKEKEPARVHEYQFSNVDSILEMDKGDLFMGHMCNKLYKRTLFDNLRFNESVKSLEDLLINHYLMFKSDKVVFFDDGLYYYRPNPNSSLRTKTFNKSYLTILDATKEIVVFYQQNMPEHIHIGYNEMLVGYYNVIYKLTECKAVQQYNDVLKKCLKSYRDLYSQDYADRYKGYEKLYKKSLRISYPLFRLLYRLRCLKLQICN